MSRKKYVKTKNNHSNKRETLKIEQKQLRENSQHHIGEEREASLHSSRYWTTRKLHPITVSKQPTMDIFTRMELTRFGLEGWVSMMDVHFGRPRGQGLVVDHELILVNESFLWNYGVIA